MLRLSSPLTWALLILISFSTLIVSCAPPLNDFRYADNVTLLEQAVTQLESNPATGWNHILGGASPVRPWPADSNGIVNIKYCFVNAYTKSKVQPAILGGWQLWYSRLGNAGPGNGHSLGGFSETTSGGQSLYCYLGQSMTWNPSVPPGTVRIMVKDNADDGQATMGYRPSEWDNLYDRHGLRLGYHPRNPVAYNAYVAAHEMGHVFGFTHEHQRPDRDHHVHFECKNLKNYDVVAQRVQHHDTRFSPWSEIGFAAFDYSTQPFWELFHWKDGKSDGAEHKYTMTYDRAYDYKSIMHYPSILNAQKAKKKLDAPLLKWKNGGEGYTPPNEATDENTEEIWYGRVPTVSDIQALKMMYPWNG